MFTIRIAPSPLCLAILADTLTKYKLNFGFSKRILETLRGSRLNYLSTFPNEGMKCWEWVWKVTVLLLNTNLRLIAQGSYDNENDHLKRNK